MVRRRNVDRELLDQASSGILLDEDDQDNIINQLTMENFNSFKKFRKYISYLLLVELTAIFGLPIDIKSKLLVNLSIALSLLNVNIERFTISRTWIVYSEYANWFLSLLLLLVSTYSWNVKNLCTLLPLFNVTSYYICRISFLNINEGVDQLSSFKYKYKSV